MSIKLTKSSQGRRAHARQAGSRRRRRSAGYPRSECGRVQTATIEDTTVEDFDNLFAVNVRAPFFLVQQLLQILCSGSSVVLLSSLAARVPIGTLLSAYTATKGAVDALVKPFASAFGPSGIRVNGVAPGVTDTEIVTDTEMSSFAKTEAGRSFILAIQALQRISEPADIGPVVAFLASDYARWITGTTIQVDGGSKL